MPKYDVIIVGAGPAGSALAIELATEGLAVILVDAARFPRDKICGDYVSPRGLARLRSLGCAALLDDRGRIPIRRSHLYLGSERLVAGTLPCLPGLPDAGLAIPRLELDEQLFRLALAAGAQAWECARVRHFQTDASGVTVTVSCGGRTLTERAQLVIGADGANSAVARIAGMRMNDPRHTLASIRSYVHGLTLDHTVMYFDRTFFPGYGWIFPVRPGLCNVGVGMVSEPLIRSRLRLPNFYAKFCRVVTALGDAHSVKLSFDRQRGWPIRSYGGAHRNFFERGLLVGEAGSFVDPLNGEGIPLALESAHIAARTIRAAFRRGRFDAPALARYETDFRAAFDPDLGLSDLIVSMIRNRRLLPVWLTMLRNLSAIASRDPGYAEIAGGILGGVIPAREGLRPHMFARTLGAAPAVTMASLSREWPSSLAALLARGRDLLSWQANLARATVDDGPWLRAWLREIEAKQRRIGAGSLTHLLAGARGRSRAPRRTT